MLRTIDLGNALGALLGGLTGLLFDILVGGSMPGGPTEVFVCALAGAALVSAWSNGARGAASTSGVLAMVKPKAALRMRKAAYPGITRLPVFDDASSRRLCSRCTVILTPDDDGLVPRHDWKHRLYVGVLVAEMPQTARLGSSRVLYSSPGMLLEFSDAGNLPTQALAPPDSETGTGASLFGVERPTAL